MSLYILYPNIEKDPLLHASSYYHYCLYFIILYTFKVENDSFISFICTYVKFFTWSTPHGENVLRLDKFKMLSSDWLILIFQFKTKKLFMPHIDYEYSFEEIVSLIFMFDKSLLYKCYAILAIIKQCLILNL